MLFRICTGVCFCLNSSAQTFPDSLEQIFENKTSSYTEKIKVCERIGLELLNSDGLRSRLYARKGLRLARTEKDTAHMATFAHYLGVGYHMGQNPDSAHYFLRQAAVWAKQVRDAGRTALIQIALANLYNSQSKADSALIYYQKALFYFERQPHENNIAAIKGNMAALYQRLGQQEQARKYFLEALPIAEKMENRELTGQIYYGLMPCVLPDTVKVLDFGTKALQAYREAGNKFGEAATLDYLGWIYFSKEKESGKAIAFLEQALRISQKYHFTSLAAEHTRKLIHIYTESGRFQLAEKYLEETLMKADTMDYGQMRRLCDSFFHFYFQKGDKAQALEYHRKLIHYYLLSGQKNLTESLAEMEVKYESEKKDQQIESLHKQKQLFLIISSVSILAILFFIATVLLMNRYQRQKRLRMQTQMEKLEQEKQLIAAEALLNGENHERARLSRELHDGLGGLLTMVKLDLGRLRQQTTPKIDNLDHALSLMDKSIYEMRRLAHNLMPESLVRFGLRPVIAEFCDSAPQIHFFFYGQEKRYSEKTEINIYRTTCELINNTLKHADASEINVQLIISDDKLSLTVQDDGKGFDPHDIREGLATVRSRVALLGATMQIYSAPNKGSEITIELENPH